MERWTGVVSRTGDSLGVQAAFHTLDGRLREIGLRPGPKTPTSSLARLWESEAGFAGGTLVIGHLDVPLPEDTPHHRFRREGELLHAEGIAGTRGPLAMLETALRCLRQRRLLKRNRVMETP